MSYYISEVLKENIRIILRDKVIHIIFKIDSLLLEKHIFLCLYNFINQDLY